MVRKIDWENQIGRRLKLRDLHVFSTVVQRGSMGKAAAQLRVSQAAVSEAMADLEHALGVPLLDRSHRGVEPTMYGLALLKRGTAAFDELKQSIRDIESLADPTTGEVRIGCAESISTAMLPPVIERFFQQYPRVSLSVHRLATPTLELSELRERRLDVVLARIAKLASGSDDLNVEVIFDDVMVLAAGMQTRWAQRSRIDLAELIDEPWIMTPPNTWSSVILTEAFRARGLEMPKACLTTLSVPLRINLLSTGPYITAFPNSVLYLDPNLVSLKILPVDLPARPWPLAVVTLKNRTLSPIVERFIEHVRAFARSIATRSSVAKSA